MKMEYSRIPTTRIAGSGRLTVPEYGDFKISGSGRISPEGISTSGSSLIPGGLTVGSLKTSGSSKIEGDITAENVKFSGSVKVDGGLTCEELKKSGSLLVEKDLKIKYGTLSGSAKIRGSGYVEREIESSGSIQFGGSLSSEEKILYSGVMRVDGKVTAKSFEARLSRDESELLGGIDADYINIQLSHDDWRNRGTLLTTDITGDEIILENVECNNVTGRKVTILAGCRIKGKVKYSETVQVNPSSKLDIEPEKLELLP